jgi:exoribonuclease II
LSAPRLLEKCGALASSHDYHFGRFLFEYFPKGRDFDPALAAQAPDGLPPAGVDAFSIDDAATTEIDDAFSLLQLPNGNWQVGIHIAVPALGIAAGSALDAEAAKRMSTVYFPGGKITMLPEAVIEQFTLSEGRECPALSMYVEVTPGLSVVGTRTQADRVRISRNLRHDQLDPVFDDDAVAAGHVASDYGDTLLLLHRLAVALEAGRGKADSGAQRLDYSFHVEDDRVRIVPRRRGSPIDKVVSELMILVNNVWAKRLSEAQVPGLYRAQSNGKVRMSTVPAPHQGLGLDQYVWASSPLRRYADLVNQRQLLSVVLDAPPAYAKGDDRLFEILRGFELTYDAYADFQRQMERYWCLRWLLQEQVEIAGAAVIRDELVRIDRIPLVCRVPSLPPLPAGTRVEVALSGIDLLEVAVHCEFRRQLEPESADITASGA